MKQMSISLIWKHSLPSIRMFCSSMPTRNSLVLLSANICLCNCCSMILLFYQICLFSPNFPFDPQLGLMVLDFGKINMETIFSDDFGLERGAYQICSEQHYLFFYHLFADYQKTRKMSLATVASFYKNALNPQCDSGSEGSTDGDEAESSIWNRKACPSKKVKSSLCRNFSEYGSCRYGLKCQFAHGVEELRCNVDESSYKTKPCKQFWKKGSCPYGFRCNFSHSSHSTPSPSSHPQMESTEQFWDIVFSAKSKNTMQLFTLLQ